MAAREGIEPPTRGFSAASRGFHGFINQSLAASCRPLPRHITAQLRHTQSELVTSLAESGMRECAAHHHSQNLTASWLQPYHLPKRKSAFRACVPLLGQCERLDASHGRHRKQSSLASLAIYVEWSWSALQQSRFGLGIFIYCPMIRQGLVYLKEIGPPGTNDAQVLRS
jgi:hypothetical protein